MTSKKTKMPESISHPTYFKSLMLKGVKCFKEEQTIHFANGDKPFQWNIILGNNNTGKTTLLRALADLEPIQPYLEKDRVLPDLCFPRSFDRHPEQTGMNSQGFVLSSLLLGEKISSKNINHNNYHLIPSEANIRNLFKTMTTSNIRDYCWGFGRQRLPGGSHQQFKGLKIYGYGTSRRTGKVSLSSNDLENDTASLFSDEVTLTNTEEWLLQTDYAIKNEHLPAVKRLEKIKKLLTSGLLPDVRDFKFETSDDFKSFVSVETDYGWCKLSELGYGYQTTVAWVVDLAKKMFERYPNSPNPLSESAVVLIDEIDLHLHPEWQRKIVAFLSKHFPNTQFIATSHSPLVVQSGDEVNVIILQKEGDQVKISQPQFKSFKGWTVEEILNDLMGMNEKTQSDVYLELINHFDQALDAHNYPQANKVYKQLLAILHPESVQRKLLKIQLASIKNGHP